MVEMPSCGICFKMLMTSWVRLLAMSSPWRPRIKFLAKKEWTPRVRETCEQCTRRASVEFPSEVRGWKALKPISFGLGMENWNGLLQPHVKIPVCIGGKLGSRDQRSGSLALGPTNPETIECDSGLWWVYSAVSEVWSLRSDGHQ